MKIIKYAVINILFALCLYYGFFKGVNGAQNVALFLAWLHVIIGAFSITDALAEVLRKTDRTVPYGFDVTLDLAISSVFFWHDRWVIGSLYLLSSMMIEGARNSTPKNKINTAGQ